MKTAFKETISEMTLTIESSSPEYKSQKLEVYVWAQTVYSDKPRESVGLWFSPGLNVRLGRRRVRGGRLLAALAAVKDVLLYSRDCGLHLTLVVEKAVITAITSKRKRKSSETRQLREWITQFLGQNSATIRAYGPQDQAALASLSSLAYVESNSFYGESHGYRPPTSAFQIRLMAPEGCT
jgi:hypothetical protein